LTQNPIQADKTKYCQPEPTAVDFHNDYYQTYKSASAQVAEIYSMDRQ